MHVVSSSTFLSFQNNGEKRTLDPSFAKANSSAH